MTRWLALLRGINVGKARRMAMADWRELLQAQGCRDVKSVLNSGNAVFEHACSDARLLGEQLQRGLGARFGFEPRLTLRSIDKLRAEVEAMPWQVDDGSRLLLAFAREAADLRPAEALLARDWGPDRLQLRGAVAYLWCEAGVLDSPLSQAFSKLIGEQCTLRNWSTVNKCLLA
ncbi:DUF1697 domain-containing protein [Paucibacter sp. APW11]|uniref:DUF1697 domain-containing protein n=1 Tax=Roseateles aquae TaxID=3077235 RepID=A0ABU3PBS6_9BURK|nr:DUF1697 domain-containing protein [Paucibacter sp. APW11]MDT9000004.1 DUF1697 domain-containing protein [Paucibacter sp. APW11]